VSIAGISVIRYTPVTPVAPVNLGQAEGAKPVQSGGSEDVSITAPLRAAPPPGMGILVDKMV